MRRDLRADVAALCISLIGAGAIVAFDLQTSAEASEPRTALMSVDAAVAAAQEQGASAEQVRSPFPVYDGEHDARVWRVVGEDTAVIDAQTGELLEISFD